MHRPSHFISLIQAYNVNQTPFTQPSFYPCHPVVVYPNAKAMHPANQPPQRHSVTRTLLTPNRVMPKNAKKMLRFLL